MPDTAAPAEAGTQRTVDPASHPIAGENEGHSVPAEDDSIEDLHDQIALRAYLIAESRGFAPGEELQDWLQAEREIRDGRGAHTSTQ
jgi:hypothetical protein